MLEQIAWHHLRHLCPDSIAHLDMQHFHPQFHRHYNHLRSLDHFLLLQPRACNPDLSGKQG